MLHFIRECEPIRQGLSIDWRTRRAVLRIGRWQFRVRYSAKLHRWFKEAAHVSPPPRPRPVVDSRDDW